MVSVERGDLAPVGRGNSGALFGASVFFTACGKPEAVSIAIEPIAVATPQRPMRDRFVTSLRSPTLLFRPTTVPRIEAHCHVFAL